MDYEKLYAPSQLINKRSNEVTLPEDASMEEIAIALAPLALHTLADVAANSEKDVARVAAANAILDRGHGKPGQSVTVYAGKENMRMAWQAVDAEFTEIMGPVLTRAT